MAQHNNNTFAGSSKRPFSKAAASEEARRYVPHFVWPFTSRMGLGERISPTSVSDLRVLFNVEPLSDARTLLADFFNILLCEVPDDLRQRSMTLARTIHDWLVRSSRPAGLFSFGLLDGPPVRLPRPYLRKVPAGFGLERLATAFMNNPGY